MKTVILFILAFTLSGCFSVIDAPGDYPLVKPAAPQVSWPKNDDNQTFKYSGEVISKMGGICQGMPKAYLKNAGYTKDIMLDSYREGNTEYITFSDVSTEKEDDEVIFIIEDGKIRSWFNKNN